MVLLSVTELFLGESERELDFGSPEFMINSSTGQPPAS